MDVEKVKELLPAAEIEKDLAVQKAIDFIKANAVITEAAKEEKKAPAKKTTAKKTEKTEE